MAKLSTVFWKLIKNWGLLVLWLPLAISIVIQYLGWQPDPEAEKLPFASITPESLRTTLIALIIEIVVLYLIMRPWSYQRSSPRPIIALIIFVPWTLFSMMISMHASSDIFLHWMWLVVLDFVLVICYCFSLATALIDGYKKRKLKKSLK